MASENLSSDDAAAVERCGQLYARIQSELADVVVGHHEVIEELLVALLARGHVLLEAVPGLGKTLVACSLAEAAGLAFKRIQLTTDLTPDDLAGGDVVEEEPETGRRERRHPEGTRAGPLFANMVLADGIDCTPPKTQVVFLEAIGQHRLSVTGTLHRLPEPFFLVATQNPGEHKGVYPLAAAGQDRFLLHVKLAYPSGEEEWEIARQATSGASGRIAPVSNREEVIGLQELVRRMPIADEVFGYAWALVRSSRPNNAESADFVDRWVARGVGPRGLVALVSSAKARALLHGRPQATVEDVQALARPALRHRITGSEAADAHALSSDRLVEMLVETIPADRQYAKPSQSAE